MKEWEAITSYFALSRIFQAKLNPRSLNLVQYLQQNLFWICWLKSWQVPEFTDFPTFCRATWVPTALNASAGPCRQSSTTAQMGPSHSSLYSSCICG